MSSTEAPWSLRRRGNAKPGEPGRIWNVRFCVEGVEGELSTGTRDREEALLVGGESKAGSSPSHAANLCAGYLPATLRET